MTRLRATAEATPDHDGPYDDPSEDLLYMLLEDLRDGTSEFFILEALDLKPDTYIQVTIDAERGYQVERRAGRQNTHQHVFITDLDRAHAEVTAWAFPAAPTPTPPLQWTAGYP